MPARVPETIRHRVRPRTRAAAWAAAIGLVAGAPIAAPAQVEAAAPRLELLAWSDSLVPSVYSPADSLARRSFPPDSLADADRPQLAASYRARPPAVDGSLEDWPLVRWNDLAGAGSIVRGAWSGPADFELRFALCWTPEGLLLGARLQDDRMDSGPAPLHRLESITLGIATTSPAVQRHWMGGSRRVRLRVDGQVDGWTDLRNRRLEPFDAAALGVHGAVRRATDGGKSVEVELLIPWMALYPALPGTPGSLLANVFLDDVDGEVEKQAAWSTRVRGRAPRPIWAGLGFAGAPPEGVWMVATGTSHPESTCEWVMVRCGKGGQSGAIEIRPAGGAFAGWKPLRAQLPRAAATLVRLHDVPQSAALWPRERRFAVALQLPGATDVRRFDLVLPLAPAALPPALAAARADTAASGSERFPSAADVEVRLAAARRALDGMGAWPARRFHATGILAWRAAAWAALDAQLEAAATMQSALGVDSATARARLVSRWPDLGFANLPRGEPLLRGYRSVLDGGAQPYVVLVPKSAAPGAPLLVALHDLGADESSLLESTSLAAQCDERGWVLACPYGRGDSGYQAAGERDVLDVVAAVRAALPVDGRRLYLTGSGMGGTGTWLLALRHPALFAAASVVSGYGDLDQSGIFEALGLLPAERGWFEAHNPLRLVRPGLATAFRIAHGERDAVVSPVHARILHARFEELGIAHEYRLDPTGDHGPRFFDDDLAAGLDFLSRHHRDTEGMATFARFDAVGPPLADVFGRGPFAIVWGTRAPEPPAAGEGEATALGAPSAADRTAAERLAAEWTARCHGVARVLPDSAVTTAMLQTMNLVLVGDATSSALLARWADRLPVRYDPDAVVVGGKAYPLAKYGIVFAAGNPEFAARTLVVLSGFSAAENLLSVLPRSPLELGVAYAIVSPTLGLVEVGDFAPAGPSGP